MQAIADGDGGRRAEQRHREHDRQERGRQPQSADLEAEQLAAERQDEQESEQRQRRPVLGAARHDGAENRRSEDQAGDDRRVARDAKTLSSVFGEVGCVLNPHAPCAEPHNAVRSLKLSLSAVRRRLEPLRVRPFGRLLGSYTINDLGDSIGVVALSILVYDRTESVAPTAGFFLVAKFLPALLATGLTAHLDRFSLRKTLPALYGIEALAFAALAFVADGDRFFLPLVLALGLLDGTLAITGRGLTRGAVGRAAEAQGPDQRGQRADEPRLRRRLGLRRGAGGRADRALGRVGRAARRRRVLRGDRDHPGRGQGPPPARARGPHAVARALRRRARVRARQPARADAARRPVAGARLLHDRRPDRGHLRQGEPGDDAAPASGCCCPPGAPGS